MAGVQIVLVEVAIKDFVEAEGAEDVAEKVVAEDAVNLEDIH